MNICVPARRKLQLRLRGLMARIYITLSSHLSLQHVSLSLCKCGTDSISPHPALRSYLHDVITPLMHMAHVFRSCINHQRDVRNIYVLRAVMVYKYKKKYIYIYITRVLVNEVEIASNVISNTI